MTAYIGSYLPTKMIVPSNHPLRDSQGMNIVVNFGCLETNQQIANTIFLYQVATFLLRLGMSIVEYVMSKYL